MGTMKHRWGVEARTGGWVKWLGTHGWQGGEVRPHGWLGDVEVDAQGRAVMGWARPCHGFNPFAFHLRSYGVAFRLYGIICTARARDSSISEIACDMAWPIKSSLRT